MPNHPRWQRTGTFRSGLRGADSPVSLQTISADLADEEAVAAALAALEDDDDDG